ncbi:hypothetical protein OQA87_22755, partial [Yersinia intermedia]
VVNTTLKPADFGVSASALVLQDLDGDTGLSSSLDTAAVTWVWKNGTVALTAAQLAAPFSTNFLGKTLTVSASVPVTVSSLTGAPTTNPTPQPLSSATYSLVVPAAAPVVRVNGTSFAMNSGFPKTGFSQAQFQFWMNGTDATGNSNYTFAPDPLAPWVTVNATTGVVKFATEPTEAQTVTITITDNRGGPATPFAFRVGTWFINSGSYTTDSEGADAYCATYPGYAAPYRSVLVNSVGAGQSTRVADGTLWPEWGNLVVAEYSGSGWSTTFFTNDLRPIPTYLARSYFESARGVIGSHASYQSDKVACARSL